ncbi:MAG TPA: hypothetical protein PKW66_06345, partial [Polyangiaceae bacterium]|nr:hypothetical protein [Polyangiaceae bacterium]
MESAGGGVADGDAGDGNSGDGNSGDGDSGDDGSDERAEGGQWSAAPREWDEEGTKSFEPVAKYKVISAPRANKTIPKMPNNAADSRWERRDTVIPQEQKKPHNPLASWKATAAIPTT